MSITAVRKVYTKPLGGAINREAGSRSKPRSRFKITALGRAEYPGNFGETPMPLSNTPSHNPLKQRAVTGSGYDW
jgi:hypothetical protein